MMAGPQIVAPKNLKAGSSSPVDTFASESAQLNARLTNVVLGSRSQSFKVFFSHVSLFLINSPSESLNLECHIFSGFVHTIHHSGWRISSVTQCLLDFEGAVKKKKTHTLTH